MCSSPWKWGQRAGSCPNGSQFLLSKIQKDNSFYLLTEAAEICVWIPMFFPVRQLAAGEGPTPRRERSLRLPLPAWDSQCSFWTHTQSWQEKQVSFSSNIISRSNPCFSTNGLLYGYSCWIANNKTFINQICSTVDNKMRASIRKKKKKKSEKPPQTQDIKTHFLVAEIIQSHEQTHWLPWWVHIKQQYAGCS